jgi:hypothetical protein
LSFLALSVHAEVFERESEQNIRHHRRLNVVWRTLALSVALAVPLLLYRLSCAGRHPEPPICSFPGRPN